MVAPLLGVAGLGGAVPAATGGANALQAILGLGHVGAGVASALRKQDLPFGLQAALQQAADAQQYLRWGIDPSSGAFQDLALLFEGQSNRSVAEAIKAIMAANARAAATGRTPVGVAPERRDESVYRALLQNRQRSAEQSRLAAHQFLINAAGKSGGIANAFSTAGRSQGQLDLFNRTNVNSAIDAIFKTLSNPQTQGLFKSAGQPGSPLGNIISSIFDPQKYRANPNA